MLYANAIHLLYTLRVFGAVLWLIQNLNPDDLALQLVVRHEAQVIVQVPLVLEGLDPAAVVAQPVLLINSY